MRYTLLDTSGLNLKKALNELEQKQQVDLAGTYNATTEVVTLSANVNYDFTNNVEYEIDAILDLSGIIPDNATVIIEDINGNISNINNILNYVSSEPITFGQMKQVMQPYDITVGRYRWIFDATYNEAVSGTNTIRTFSLPATVVTPRSDVVQIVTNTEMLDAITAQSWTGSSIVTPSDDDGYVIGGLYQWNNTTHQWADITPPVPTIKIFTNTAVATGAFAADTTYTDYGYKGTIPLSGVTATMYAEVVYSLDNATSGDYAPITETYDGGVYVYSKVNTAITIPTIQVTGVA